MSRTHFYGFCAKKISKNLVYPGVPKLYKFHGFLISPVIFWQLAPGTHRGMSGLFNIIVNSVNFDLIDPLDATQEFTGG